MTYFFAHPDTRHLRLPDGRAYWINSTLEDSIELVFDTYMLEPDAEGVRYELVDPQGVEE